MAGEQLDLSSEPPRPPASSERDDQRAITSAAARRFVGVQFDCCAVYARIYVNRDHTAYEGRCPRCARAIRLEIGPGGTTSRFFVAR
jgi:hypothetical protein